MAPAAMAHQTRSKSTCRSTPSDQSKSSEEPASTNLDQLELDIAELSAHIQAATYRLLCLVRAYDQLEGWVTGGFISCAHWLAWRTGDDLITAREKVRVARALEQLPLISAAFARAELSYSKVRAITRVATPENETHLLPMGLEATASQLERVVRGVRRARPLELAEAQAQYDGRYVQYHYDENGMMQLRARLTPEAGALLVKALEAATSALQEQEQNTDKNQEPDDIQTPATSRKPNSDDRSFSQLQADALVLLAESTLDHQLARGNQAERYQVVVHVDAETLKDQTESPIPEVATLRNSAETSTPTMSQVATLRNSAETSQPYDAPLSAKEPSVEETAFQSELENGIGLCVETSQRLACNCSTITMVENPEGDALHVGRKTRRPTTALSRALQTRDRGCQFPGCNHTRYVEAHHLVHWAKGGPTSLTNLVLLCSYHHHAVHEQGFRVSRSEEGSLQFYHPNGTLLLNAFRPLRLVANPIPLLHEQHLEQELEITHRSGGPTEWTGVPFDLGEAVSLVLPGEVQDDPAENHILLDLPETNAA